jgi:hypothetical protein
LSIVKDQDPDEAKEAIGTPQYEDRVDVVGTAGDSDKLNDDSRLIDNVGEEGNLPKVVSIHMVICTRNKCATRHEQVRNKTE